MQGFEAIVEQRIAEAGRRGDFDALPGAGRPLELDDDRLVPEDLRIAYRILKNAGYVPPEVQAMKDIAELERLVQVSEGAQRTTALRRLRLLTLRMRASRGGNLQLEAEYYDRLVERLA